MPSETPAAPVGDEVVSYANDIEPLVSNFCATCHQGKEPDGGFVLDTYAHLRAHVEKGKLLERIEDTENPMPPNGRLPAHLRRLFKKWADGGYARQGGKKRSTSPMKVSDFKPPTIRPVDITKQGFEFLERMQGHWIGSMNLMGQEFEWMAFDFRPIGPSHVHGMFEGGTIGNLFTSFFVTRFKGTRTIMVRNGGLLNGIYRTSYFVLHEVSTSGGETRYQFVDAYGGKQIMWIEVVFRGDTIRFRSYTSRMGLLRPPTRHMSFEGSRNHMHLARAAAKAVGFPKNVIDRDFSKGLPKPDWGPKHTVTSASYMWEEKGKDLLALAKLAKDPYRIDHMPHVGRLMLNVKRGREITGKKLVVLLSDQALVDAKGKYIGEHGYVREDRLNTILLFPEISGGEDRFELTYLHPGKYYLTVVADMDGDGFPGPGDITHPQRQITVKPRSKGAVIIDDLTVRN